MRRYTVEWERPGENVVLACHGLTPRVLVARLRSAARLNGVVIVRSIEPERAGPLEVASDIAVIRASERMHRLADDLYVYAALVEATSLAAARRMERRAEEGHRWADELAKSPEPQEEPKK